MTIEGLICYSKKTFLKDFNSGFEQIIIYELILFKCHYSWYLWSDFLLYKAVERWITIFTCACKISKLWKAFKFNTVLL